MQWTGLWAPRDPSAAARAASAFSLTSVGATTIAAVISPSVLGQGGARVVCVLTLAGLAALGLVTLHRPLLLPPIVWALMPSIVVVMILFLDLLSRDASAAGQMYLCWPVLYAGHQLSKPAAILVLVEAIGAEAAIVLTLLPTDRGLADLVPVAATLTVMALLLVFMREHEERLIGQLHRLAIVDDLTGLVARREFDRAAEAMLRSDASLSLVLVDIDRFKQINDAYGHPVGDDVLVRVADLLRVSFRSDAVLARLGGDEFAVLLPGCGQGDALARASEVAATLRGQRFAVPDDAGIVRTLAVTVSLGVATATPGRPRTLRELYVAADQAMYRAKHAGRDQVGAAPPGAGVEPVESLPAPVTPAPLPRQVLGAEAEAARLSAPAAG